MEIQIIWLLKIVTAHFLTDFVLQPTSWIDDRYRKHWKSKKLYYHVLLTTFFAWFFTGFSGWAVPVVILFSHYLIDLWKSYQKETIQYFILDQVFHLLVIAILWAFLFPDVIGNLYNFVYLADSKLLWIYFFAILFLTQPSGIIIGKLTQKWRNQLDGVESLGRAGKWIGILERLIIFTLVILGQFEAIGLLTAAKSILRFNDVKGVEKRSEYVLIGTLISIGTALFVGNIVKYLTT